MRRTPKAKIASKALLPLSAALLLSLAACGKKEEQTTVEPDVTDVSGGELIVAEPTPGEVPVELPTTPMTNVPPEPSASASPTAAQ